MPGNASYDSGLYMLLVKVSRRLVLRTKSREFHIRPAFYVYIGSAKRNLKRRIERHMAAEKKMHWHIDFLLEKASLIEARTICFSNRLDEASLACEIIGKSDFYIPGFGASDSSAPSHLAGFRSLDAIEACAAWQNASVH